MIDRDMRFSVGKTYRSFVRRIKFSDRFKYCKGVTNEFTFCEYAKNEVRVTKNRAIYVWNARSIG